MSTPYAGDATSFPSAITRPSDGDGPTIKAADVNVGLEGLADRTANLKARVDAVGGVSSSTTFTATTATTWTAPTNAHRIRVRGWGAGGGGGGGALGGTGVDDYASGGGGGGGAVPREEYIDVTPGTIYEVVCGAGGTAGTAGMLDGGDGGDGGDTIFRVQGGATLATFKGAQGGFGGRQVNLPTSADLIVAVGGASTRGFQRLSPADGRGSFCTATGFGGEGVTQERNPASPNQFPRIGAPSVTGFAGGTGGLNGIAVTGVARGGGAGGGGGGGPAGAGLNGKSGGDGSSGTGGNAPVSGGSATAGGGQGGGGGGGGGGGASGGGLGSTGLAGISGSLQLWVIG